MLAELCADCREEPPLLPHRPRLTLGAGQASVDAGAGRKSGRLLPKRQPGLPLPDRHLRLRLRHPHRSRPRPRRRGPGHILPLLPGRHCGRRRRHPGRRPGQHLLPEQADLLLPRAPRRHPVRPGRHLSPHLGAGRRARPYRRTPSVRLGPGLLAGPRRPAALAWVSWPALTRLDSEGAREMTPLASRNTVLVSIGAAAVLMAASPILIRVLFGGDFTPATAPLMLLMPGVLAASATRVLGSYLFSQGRVIYNTYATFIALGVTLALGP